MNIINSYEKYKYHVVTELFSSSTNKIEISLTLFKTFERPCMYSNFRTAADRAVRAHCGKLEWG